MRLALSLFAVLGFGCGTDAQPPSDQVDAGMTSGLPTLLSTPWSLEGNSEKYLCLRVTMTEDVWIKSIVPIAPVGSHHAVLMLTSNPTVADGLTECSSMLPDPAIYASGVGTSRFDFPDGIGLHITAGQQLFLNLHLFNAGDVPITGVSGIQYVAGDAASIIHPAASILIGAATGATVPSGINQSLKFACQTPPATTIFAVAPHMHLHGAHLNATYTPMGGAAQTVLDTDYSFDDQAFHPITPIVTGTKGKYVVTCTYNNGNGDPIPFGESTTQEMCFAMTYVYPPPGVPTCGTEI